MLRKNAFELRDPDGTYVVARPMGSERCLVLLSNLFSTGDILRKADGLPWSHAAVEEGLRTHISPHELHSSDDDESDPSSFDGRPDDEDILRETHESIESRSHEKPVLWTLRSRGSESGMADSDPAALALRLMIHYLVVHEKPRSATRRVEVCRCDRYSPGTDLTLASIHAIVYSAVRKRQGPGLARIQRAIARAARALVKKEEKENTSAIAA